MPDIRAQVIIKTTSGVSDDFVTNTWAFHVNDQVDNTPDVADALWAFYNAFETYYPATIAQNGHEIKFYELPGLTPNYPFYETTRNFTGAPTGTTLPSEVSLVCSFQADRISGFPQSRRRGRIYFGPLDEALNNNGRPTDAARTAFCAQMENLFDAVIAVEAGCYWGVWSSTDGSISPVVNGWVDNAWDTQRRRGVSSTARTTWGT